LPKTACQYETIWSCTAVCLALQSVLLSAVFCVCLVTLLVAAGCLSRHSVHVESKRDSESDYKAVHWKDLDCK